MTMTAQCRPSPWQYQSPMERSANANSSWSAYATPSLHPRLVDRKVAIAVEARKPSAVEEPVLILVHRDRRTADSLAQRLALQAERGVRPLHQRRAARRSKDQLKHFLV